MTIEVRGNFADSIICNQKIRLLLGKPVNLGIRVSQYLSESVQ